MPRLCMPILVEAALLEVSGKKLKREVYELASGVYECSRLHLSSVLSALALDIANGTIPVVMFAYVLYDETPLRASVAAAPQPNRKGSHRPRRSERSSETCKIEQCELVLGFVVRKPGAERCSMVHTELVCPLQNSDRNTGEVVRRHLLYFKAIPMWESLKSKFPVVLELSTRDRGSGNLRGERALAQNDPGAIYFGQWCSIHCLHCIAGRMLGSIASTVSGAIAIGLAQRDAAEEDTFRGWFL